MSTPHDLAPKSAATDGQPSDPFTFATVDPWETRVTHAGALQVCLIPLFLLASYIVKGQREVEKM